MSLQSSPSKPAAILFILWCLLIAPLSLLMLGIGIAGLFWGALWISVLVLPVSVFLIAFSGMGIVILRGLFLPRPVLVIDQIGILDHRLGCGRIAWSNISKIVSLDPIQAGLLITLRRPVRARFTRLRPGAFMAIWRLPPSTVYVAMKTLEGPHIPPEDIRPIAERNGVEWEARRFHAMTGRSVPVVEQT